MTEDEMVGWHHCLNRHESEQAPGDSEDREVHGVRVGLDLVTEQQQLKSGTMTLRLKKSKYLGRLPFSSFSRTFSKKCDGFPQSSKASIDL